MHHSTGGNLYSQGNVANYFTNTNNVPVDIGEYGIVHEAFDEDTGACEYTKDFNIVTNGDNINSIKINRFYYVYQSLGFGLYTNWSGFKTNNTDVNNKLKDYFETRACSSDTTSPTISETTPVPTPTNDTAPNYTFNTDEAGTITYV